MSTAILLTGRPGSGKTTLIQHVLARVESAAGGFYTREIAPDGTRQGFEMVTLDGETGILAHRDIARDVVGSPRVGSYSVDVAALDAVGVASIRRALANAALIVIDEIGPMEFYSDAFKQAVIAALDSDPVVLGTIVQRHTPFGDWVKARPDVTVIEVRRDSRDTLGDTVLARLQSAGLTIHPAQP